MGEPVRRRPGRVSGKVKVRVLAPGDAIAVRDLRLQGLRLSPQSFGSAWEEEAPLPLAWWEKRLAGPARWFGAEIDFALVGLTVVSPNLRMKHAHNADIGAVYVDDRFRRRGVAAALMQSTMAYLAEARFANATLTVSADNVAAQKLYERFGFRACGQLQRELNVDGSFSDELIMRAQIF
jgi:ribosomal protein S18 acetylase RimI-like enzyme